MSQTYQWTPEAVALLGTAIDSVIAEKLKLHKATVGIERRRRGIPAWKTSFLEKKIWNAQVFARMGRMPDRDLAEMLGVSPSAVSKKRISLGIPSFVKRNAWRPSEVAMLGSLTDKAIADLLDRDAHRVGVARRRRHIPRCPAETWVDVVAHQLGVVPDAEIAEAIGVSTDAVGSARRRRKIPPVAPHEAQVPLKTVHRPQKQRRPWLPEEIALFGKYSDAEVARRTGRTKSGVKMERTNRRIPGVDPAEAGRQYRRQQE